MQIDEAHIRARFKELRSGLAANTYSTYTQALKRLYNVSPKLEIDVLRKYFKKQSPTQARNLLTALVIYDGERWRLLFRKFAHEAEDTIYNQSLTDKESRNWATMDTIKRFVNRLRADVGVHKLWTRDALNSHQERMLLGYVAWSVHLEFPMRRDLCTFKIAPSRRVIDDKQNWFIPHSGTFLLNNFKTAKHFKRRGHKPLELNASLRLQRILRRFLAHRPGATYLIEKEGKPISRASYNNLFRFVAYRYTGRKIGTTMFRHIAVSDFLSRDPTMKAKAQMLKRMQQVSFATQMRYRRRLLKG